jgi:hypothetical protein
VDGGRGGEQPRMTPTARRGRAAHRRELSWRSRRWRRRGAALAALREMAVKELGRTKTVPTGCRCRALGGAMVRLMVMGTWAQPCAVARRETTSVGARGDAGAQLGAATRHDAANEERRGGCSTSMAMAHGSKKGSLKFTPSVFSILAI